MAFCYFWQLILTSPSRASHCGLTCHPKTEFVVGWIQSLYEKKIGVMVYSSRQSMTTIRVNEFVINEVKQWLDSYYSSSKDTHLWNRFQINVFWVEVLPEHVVFVWGNTP